MGERLVSIGHPDYEMIKLTNENMSDKWEGLTEMVEERMALMSLAVNFYSKHDKVCVCTCICVCVCMYACMYMHVCTCMYVCMYVTCMYIIYMYVCMYVLFIRTMYNGFCLPIVYSLLHNVQLSFIIYSLFIMDSQNK